MSFQNGREVKEAHVYLIMMLPMHIGKITKIHVSVYDGEN